MRRILAFVLAIPLTAACGSDPVPFLFDAIGVDTPAADIGGTDVEDDADTEDDVREDAPPGDVRPDAEPDADASEDAPDAGPDAEPDTPPGAEFGEDCERNSDCESSICVLVDADRNVCTDACGDGCLAGWDCLDDICRCSATLEICDGADNDCDGEVDEGEDESLGCSAPEVCVDGGCGCLSGIECEGACVDVTSDSLNCGECGFVCSEDTVCSDSECVCPDDFTLCGEICVDTTSDAEFCGNCDTACREGRVCADSSCVCPGEFGVACDDVCVDVSTDPSNCGGCGEVCAADEECSDSTCVCATGLTDCDGACVDTTADDDNCGACGAVCGLDEVCEESACACRPGLDRCGDECVNTAVDELNCGACGFACEVGDVCVSGECGCPDGLLACDGECVDTTTDIEHCGACGVVCGDDEVCNGVECVCACPDGACEADLCLPLGSGESDSIAFDFVAEPQSADIVFNMDTTGSMGGELTNLRTSLSADIIPLAIDVFADTAFAVTRYDDFPCTPYGSGIDVPFELFQRVTTDIEAVQAAVDSLGLHSGADFSESAFESLYQIATGAGQDGCTPGIVPPFDPDVDRVEGVADGEDGGVGFREGAFPIIVHITDASSHARGEDGYPYGATREEAYTALADLDARVIGVSSGAASRTFLLEVADATQARVPPCAWGDTRAATCGDDECCTASAGSGRAADDDGLCPLVFDIAGTGTGLDNSVVSGIDVLSRFSPFDVSLRVRPDEDLLAGGFDTSCLLSATELLAASDPPSGCGFEVAAADFDGDGIEDGASNVTAGTALEFGFELENSCAPDSGVYPLHFDLLVGESAVFASTSVYVFVR